MALDKEEQALMLFTNRLLMDWISLRVDGGEISREFAEKLIDFSAGEVIRGAPWVTNEVKFFADISKDRLPKKT